MYWFLSKFSQVLIARIIICLLLTEIVIAIVPRRWILDTSLILVGIGPLKVDRTIIIHNV